MKIPDAIFQEIPPIINRAQLADETFTLPDDHWYQIEVSGETFTPDTEAFGDMTQVVDYAALRSIVSEFAKKKEQPNFAGLLIDRDHDSLDSSKPTTAMGWLMDVEIRDGELYGRIRWTETGRRLVQGGEYRFFSTVYFPSSFLRIDGDRYRPWALDRLAITSDPRKKGGKPISNRNQKPNETKNKDMKELATIAALIGLPADASAADVEAGVRKQTDDFKAIQNRADELEKEIAAAKVDSLLDEHGIKDTDERSALKELYVANRDTTVKLIEARGREIKAAPQKRGDSKPIFNRSQAGQPAPMKERATEDGAHDAAMKKLEARTMAIKNRYGVSYTAARNQARLELAAEEQ
jgi:phage I-like protein